MTNRLELNWKVDGFVDEQRYYCSETPIDIDNLPTPKAIFNGDLRTYEDLDINLDRTYYIRIGSVRNGIEKISDETSVFSSIFNPLEIPTIKIVLDDESIIEKDSLNRVSKWIDRVGQYEFIQNENSYKPFENSTLNGLGVKQFNISHMRNNNPQLMNIWNSVENIWAFCVYKSTELSSVDKSIIHIKNAGDAVGFSAEAGSPAANNKPFAYARAQNSSPIGTITDSDIHVNDWVLVFYEINMKENSGKISVNGVTIIKENLWPTAPIKTQSLDAIDIEIGGLSRFMDGFRFVGSVASIMLGTGNSRVSDIDKLKLEGWAAHKYGLTDKLPIEHPYKKNSP